MMVTPENSDPCEVILTVWLLPRVDRLRLAVNAGDDTTTSNKPAWARPSRSPLTPRVFSDQLPEILPPEFLTLLLSSNL